MSRDVMDGQRMSRDVIVVYEMFNRGVEMLSLYMRCLTDESRCCRYGQRRSRDAVIVYEMFNGGVKMISLYIRYSRDALQEKVEQSTTISAMSDEILSTEESICYRYTLDVQRMSLDAIVVEVLKKSFEDPKEARARDKELFEEAKEENRKQYEEKLTLLQNRLMQRKAYNDAIVVHEMFNGGVEMISLYIRCSRDALQEKVEQSTTMSATSDEILSTEESICYRYTLDVQRMSRDAIVVHETFNGFVEMISLSILELVVVEVLKKSFEETKEERARDKELFKEAKEENRKQYEEKLTLLQNMRCSTEESR
ncbi:hypothetical protein Tco_1382731 [Tanacetum coccineum]